LRELTHWLCDGILHRHQHAGAYQDLPWLRFTTGRLNTTMSNPSHSSIGLLENFTVLAAPGLFVIL
jgi:hypothetical protein